MAASRARAVQARIEIVKAPPLAGDAAERALLAAAAQVDETAPSPWDPEPPADGRKAMENRLREERERVRMASGFYLDDSSSENADGGEDDIDEEPEDDEPSHRRPRRTRIRRVSSADIISRPRLETLVEQDRLRTSLPLLPEEEARRPKTRGECIDGPRPCPWASCSHHLYADRTKNGLMVPYAEIEDMPETCALDVADRGGSTLEQVGEILNVSRERIRQIEEEVLGRLRRRQSLGEFMETG